MWFVYFISVVWLSSRSFRSGNRLHQRTANLLPPIRLAPLLLSSYVIEIRAAIVWPAVCAIERYECELVGENSVEEPVGRNMGDSRPPNTPNPSSQAGKCKYTRAEEFKKKIKLTQIRVDSVNLAFFSRIRLENIYLWLIESFARWSTGEKNEKKINEKWTWRKINGSIEIVQIRGWLIVSEYIYF